MANAEPKLIRVEVAYARPDEQVIVPVEVPEGAPGTSHRSVANPGTIPGNPAQYRQGRGVRQARQASATVRAGDRVEIYRPLLADPKEVRKKRAAEGKRMRKGGGDLEPKAG
jgi:putative ubiquitin-RnfH superfamily antitoxin RatB of RatAB toxin-antitoxin module